jgi:hypothetical protein
MESDGVFYRREQEIRSRAVLRIAAYRSVDLLRSKASPERSRPFAGALPPG